jgi:four helix bundle protein
MAFKFESLKIWKESVKFASEIYSLTKKFPKNEQFGIITQLNRAAVSISLNIAEGEGRGSDSDLSRFIQIAIGSLNEVVTILYISLEQKYINQKEFDLFYNRCEQISRMLYAFRNYLKR